MFQAIVLFVGAKSFKELLSQSFSSLCKDPVVCVRKSLSSGFHEVCTLHPSNLKLLSARTKLLKTGKTGANKIVADQIAQGLFVCFLQQIIL